MNFNKTTERCISITEDKEDIAIYAPALEYYSIALDNTCKENNAHYSFVSDKFELLRYLRELQSDGSAGSEIFESKLSSYITFFESSNIDRYIRGLGLEVKKSLYTILLGKKSIYFSYDFFSGASRRDSVNINIAPKDKIIVKAKAWYDKNKKDDYSSKEKLALGIKCLARAYHEVIKMQPILSLDKYSHGLVIDAIRNMINEGNKPDSIRESGFGYREMKEAGVKVSAMKDCGVNDEDLVVAGFTDSEIGISKIRYKELYDQQGTRVSFPFNYTANELDEIIRPDKKSPTDIYVQYYVDCFELNYLSGDEIVESIYNMHFENIVNENKTKETIEDEFVSCLNRCDNINKGKTNNFLIEIIFFRIGIYLNEYFGVNRGSVNDLIYKNNKFKPRTNTGCIFTDIYLEICNKLEIVPELSVIDHLRSHVIKIWNSMASYNGTYGYHIEQLKILGDQLTIANVANGLLCTDLLRATDKSIMLPCDLMNPTTFFEQQDVVRTLLEYIKDVKPGLVRFEVIENALNILKGSSRDLVKIAVRNLINRELQVRYNFNKYIMERIYGKLQIGSFNDDINQYQIEYLQRLEKLKAKTFSTVINDNSKKQSTSFVGYVGISSFVIAAISFSYMIFLALSKESFMLPLAKIIFPGIVMISGIPLIHILLASVVIYSALYLIGSLSVKLNAVINPTVPDKSISFDSANLASDKIYKDNDIGLANQPTNIPK